MDLWSILIIVTIAQGIFTFGLIAFKDYGRAKSKWLLLAFLIAFLWIESEFLAIRQAYDLGVELFYGTRFGSWLLLGPLLYMYVKSITETGFKLDTGQLLHFVPFFIFAILIPLVATEFLTFRQVHYGMLTVFDLRSDARNILQWLYSGIFVSQFLHFGGYLIISFLKVSDYQNNLKEEYSNLELSNIRWLKFFLISLLVILVSATGFLVILFRTEIYRRHLDYIYVLPISVLTYIVSYRLAGVSWKKKISGNRESEQETDKYRHSSLTPEKATEYEKELKNYMATKRPYLDNDLKLNDLAIALNIPPHHLSEVLNQYMNTSFFDFINKYRVQEAKLRIKNEPNHTLLQIAYDSGFNNKTSFINAFKKFEGTTPSGYMKSVS